MGSIKDREKLLRESDERLGADINLLEGEESLIKGGLDEKTKDELISMLVNLKKMSYKDVENLSKTQLIEKLTEDL